MDDEARRPIRFTTHASLAQRVVLATLTGRAIRVDKIRPNNPTNPGLAPHEVSLLRLIESITNGTNIEISYTGTAFAYRPGLIVGSGGNSTAGVISKSGTVIRHELPANNERGVSYFLLALAMLAPFAKAPTNVLFTGPGVITSSTTGKTDDDAEGTGGASDISADTVRTAILPLYAQFGIPSSAIELRILRRSNPGPKGVGGGGECQLVFGPGSQVRLPKTVHLLNSGRVKRIRGVAYATGVGGSNNARTIEATRGVLNTFVNDIYIFSDVSNAPLIDSGNGTKRKIGLGFGLSLVAETTAGALYSADVASPPEGGVTPEEIGLRCAYQLLETVEKGGIASLAAASTAIILMAMGSEDVGRVAIGPTVLGSEQIVGLARDLKSFGASGWGVRESEDGEMIVSIVGRGVGNVGRKIG